MGLSLRERLLDRKMLMGLLQSHPNPLLTEMAGLCGYDFLMLDGEHGLFSEMDHVEGLRACRAANALAFIRLPKHDPQALGRYLDMGADVIVAPNVSTPEQAEMLARAMEYPPAGTRGAGAALHRATRYGLDTAAYLKAPRAHASLLVIIESKLGVANVAAILAVEGVDGLIIGPSDLSADLGCKGDFSQRVFAEAVAHIEAAALARHKVLGTGVYSGSPLEALAARGHRLAIVGSDISLVREAMTTQVAKARSALATAETGTHKETLPT